MNKADYVCEDTLLTRVTRVITGVLKGYAFAVVMLLIIAAVITYTSVSETYLSGAISVVTVLSIIISAVSVSKKNRTMGWLHGMITGLVYSIVLYVFAAVFLSDVGVQKSFIVSIAVGAVCGALGGIAGVNMNRK